MSDAINESWIDTAARIGARIASGAEWEGDGDACSWHVHTSQQTPGVRQGKWVPASPTLYQGTSGIALFLLELHRHTRDERILTTALGALRNAETGMSLLPARADGFHSGRTGLAYALYRGASITGRDDLLARADRMLRPLLGPGPENPGLDVIAGAAGSIPVLLIMSDRLPPEITTELALRLGDAMIARAHMRRCGWSWGGMPSSVDDLCGYAHGAAGYAHAFAELFNVTGDPVFRHGAEQAMAYEAAMFDVAAGNWPDLRHYELSEYTSVGAMDMLRDKLRSGESFPPYERKCNTLWCHGAPGIGLSRLRAFEIFGHERYRREALVAAETTLANIREEAQGYSLCHGYFGNCETLVEAARVLERPDLLDAARQRAEIGRHTYELKRRPWQGGTIGGRSDASLLLGDAGIGYYYLRLHDAATPSILCPSTGPCRTSQSLTPRDPDKLRQDHVARFFGTTLTAMRLAQPDKPFVVSPDSAPDRLVQDVHESIASRIAAETDDRLRALLGDVFAVDQLRYELDFGDRSQELIDSLSRVSLNEVDWSTARLAIARNVQIVSSERDWIRWLRTGESSGADEGITTLVYRANGAVMTRPVPPLAGVLLACASDPATVAELVERVAERIDGATPERIGAKLLEQIKSAYDSGLLAVVSVTTPAPEAVTA